MNKKQNTERIILSHLKNHPHMTVGDLFKLLYQSTFGCGHMVKDFDTASEYIKKELSQCDIRQNAPIEELDGDFCRVPLSYINEGLAPETLGSLFYLSAQKSVGTVSDLEERLETAKALAAEKKLPFSEDLLVALIEEWKSDGYPAVHHSEEYRKHHHPAYRVISTEYLPFLPVLARIDTMLEHGVVTMAIEGGSASGKSTFGALLEKIYHCTLFHMDDFFLRPEQRTQERLAQIGGNIDKERFLEQVLVPMSKGLAVEYRRFDCHTQSMKDPVTVMPGKLTVIEGAYGMHPLLEKYYNFSVFLDISPSLQRKRILKRNGADFAKRFFEEWIPMEKRYFDATEIKERCDMVIKI